MRIVSLVPGATEALFALGLGEHVVAVTHECDWPPEARRLPAVTRSRLELEGLSGGAIDDAVNRAATSGEQLYEIDVAAIRALHPDVVVTQDVCEVCAVPNGMVEGSLPGIEVVRQHAHTLADVLVGIRELGERCRADPEPLLSGLQARIERAAGEAARRPRVRAVFLEWLDPPYPAGHWTPDLLELAGLDDPLAARGGPSVATTWDAVRKARPELLVVAACGFDKPRGEAEVGRMAAEVQSLGAKRVISFDGSAYFNRPGPRLVDSLELLVAAVSARA